MSQGENKLTAKQVMLQWRRGELTSNAPSENVIKQVQLQQSRRYCLTLGFALLGLALCSLGVYHGYQLASWLFIAIFVPLSLYFLPSTDRAMRERDKWQFRGLQPLFLGKRYRFVPWSRVQTLIALQMFFKPTTGAINYMAEVASQGRCLIEQEVNMCFEKISLQQMLVARENDDLSAVKKVLTKKQDEVRPERSVQVAGL